MSAAATSSARATRSAAAPTSTTLESGGGFGADLRDEDGRLFIDGDADEFELLLKVLRGSVDPHALDTTGRATLRKMADMYSFEGILQMLADGSYDATALSEQDARLREQALTIRKALELNTINAAATADDALIDVFAKRASFAYTGVPTSPEATLLYAENQGRQQRHRVGWTAPDPDDEDQGPPRATFKRDTFDCVVGREVVEPETIDQFRERLNLFAGPLLEGLDMSNLVIAGGSVLAALTLGDPNEEERVVGADGRASMKPAAAARAVWRDARQTSSDIDMFIVADSDEQAQAVYRRVLQHFATRIAAVQHCRMTSRNGRISWAGTIWFRSSRPTRSARSCSSCGRQGGHLRRRLPAAPRSAHPPAQNLAMLSGTSASTRAGSRTTARR